MSEEVITTQTPSLSRPETLKTFSKDLKKFIVEMNLYTPIQDKNYVNVEGWQFAGISMGLVAVVTSCEKLDGRGKFTYVDYKTKTKIELEEIAYKATVEVLSGEKVVSRAFTICSNKESKKRSFDEYAIASMAQTRALGKAYRMLIGPLMKMAGYEGTPAEEMEEDYSQPERGHDVPTFCADCGKEMAVYVKGPKKGQLHCKGKSAPLGQKPSCPPIEKDEVTKRIEKELDDIPVIIPGEEKPLLGFDGKPIPF